MTKKQELGPLQLAWVEALESGKYSQGSGRLRVEEDYCCLGVLCEINDLPKSTRTATTGKCVFSYENQEAYLPNSLTQKFGFYADNGEISNAEGETLWKSIGVEAIYQSLSQANDGSVSFKDIAKLIRTYPEHIFQKSV